MWCLPWVTQASGLNVEPLGPLWKAANGQYSNLRWDEPAGAAPVAAARSWAATVGLPRPPASLHT
jgi:hypothetical protein